MGDDETELGPVKEFPFPEDVDSSFVIANGKKDSVDEIEQELLQSIQAYQRARGELIALRDQAWTELKEVLCEQFPDDEKQIQTSCHLHIIEELGVRKKIHLYTPETCPLCREDVQRHKEMASRGWQPNKVNINLVEQGSDDKTGAASGDAIDMLEEQLREKFQRKPNEPDSQEDEDWGDVPDSLPDDFG
jgi:hypothetical protein